MTKNKHKDKKGPLLDVKKLKTYFYTEEGVVHAVDGVDFHIMPGETLAIVGESGCGKSVTSLSVMQLIGQPGEIIEGEIFFNGENLLAKSEYEMCKVRGNQIAMIFQQPSGCLNPVFDIGYQVAEVLEVHQALGEETGRKRAVEWLSKVGIPDAEKKSSAFPHEISGGQAQRVMIAMMLSNLPDLLIADEPTTALDVTIQAQILELMDKMQDQFGTSILVITHDMGIVAEMADRVAVMYAGQIVEQASVFELFDNSKHPYTTALLASIPILGERKEKLSTIPGSVPNLVDLPPACRFAPRCQVRLEKQMTRCTEEMPPLFNVTDNHIARCWVYEDKK
ncbi:MAG: methionine ABC transporter ATP-binding protein [Anaerolineaceae bacterium 4572_78]|nr:MAG: methionine ABC transporter ATP-binding protein [Anaerolineaceae bacterium 4572_78]